jgi:hypothetical protein
VVALTSGREGKGVADGDAEMEITVVLRTVLELELDVTSSDKVVGAGGVTDAAARGEGDMEEVVVSEGVSETVD